MGRFPYQTITVTGWHELTALCDRFDTYWLFRGHRVGDWPLASTLERLIERTRETRPGASYGQAEEYLIDQFEREAHHYGLRFEDGDRLEILSNMQHHGVPTRLLDFTSSLYVAAFFAIADATADDVPCVWAISTRWIDQALRRLTANRSLPDSVPVEGYPRESEFPLGRILAAASDRQRAGAINEYLAFYAAASGAPAGVLHVRPYRLSERLRLQHGAFLMPLRIDKSIEQNLSELAGNVEVGVPGIYKITFGPPAQRDEYLRHFYHLNMNERTLFPGLDGFSRSLSRKYEVMAAQFFPRKAQEG